MIRLAQIVFLLLSFVGNPAGAQPESAETPDSAATTAEQPLDEAAEIARIEAHLVGLTTLEAQFVQIAPNGGMVEGTAYLWRPGRMRFDYTMEASDPDLPGDFILADGNTLHYWDSYAEQHSFQDLEDSLAWFLLREDLRLEGTVKVVDLHRAGGQLAVTLAPQDDALAGTISLVFDEIPPQGVSEDMGGLTLRGWQVVDGQGETTTVGLIDPRYGVALDEGLFRYRDPTFGREEEEY